MKSWGNQRGVPPASMHTPRTCAYSCSFDSQHTVLHKMITHLTNSCGNSCCFLSKIKMRYKNMKAPKNEKSYLVRIETSLQMYHSVHLFSMLIPE